jgi:hypothetical protein
MEGATTTQGVQPGATGAAQGSAPPQGALGALRPASDVACRAKGTKTNGCECPKCRARRQAWNDKRKRAGAHGSGASIGAKLPSAPNDASQGTAQTPVVPAVPWDSNSLKPLVSELVIVYEKSDLAKLKSAAADISPAAVAIVEREGPYSEVAKTGLISGGAHGFAKLLNYYGLSAEDAPMAAGAIGLLTILAGRLILANTLKEMAQEKAKFEETRRKVVIATASEVAERHGKRVIDLSSEQPEAPE